MIYPSVKDLLKVVGNRYQLVNVVARRAREIAQEADDMGEPLLDKPVSMAIAEIADGQLPKAKKKTEPDMAMDAAAEHSVDGPMDLSYGAMEPEEGTVSHEEPPRSL